MKREREKLEENTGQFHSDVECVHYYTNGDWVIVFTQSRGYCDSFLGVCVPESLEVKTIPLREAVLRRGFQAFGEGTELARLIMRTSIL